MDNTEGDAPIDPRITAAMEKGAYIHPAVLELLKIRSPPQRSPEWFAIRDKMLTASDLAAAIGCNPYQSREKLLRKKLGDSRYAFAGNAATKWGNDNEDVAAREYEKVTGKTCLEFGLIAHPLHPWLGGSPDRITTDGILIEIKCPMRRKITHECPKYYVPQVQVLLEILNLEVAHFVQYSPPTTWSEQVLDILEMKRDRGWFRRFFPVMQKFRNDWVEIDSKGGLEYLDKTGAFQTSGSDSDQSTPSSRGSGKRAKIEVDIDIGAKAEEEPFPFVEKPPRERSKSPPSAAASKEVEEVTSLVNFTFWS